VFGFLDLAVGVDPAQVIERRLLLADLGGHFAITNRLARLPLERRHLAGKLPDHVFQTLQVLLGRAQAQFRLVAARMQAGNAGRLFQHAAALLRLGLDDLADASLMHQRRRTRAGGCIRKQNLHVARAHFAAIDAIGRALLALDAARDFQAVMLVERRRRGAIGIVDRHRHFGVVAARPRVGAGEDHGVHIRRTHGLVRGLAHDPAQRLHQIGFATAIGPDHPGQAGFDQEVRGLYERLESDETQARKLHRVMALHPSTGCWASPPGGNALLITGLCRRRAETNPCMHSEWTCDPPAASHDRGFTQVLAPKSL
jgi:hypothetical protein